MMLAASYDNWIALGVGLVALVMLVVVLVVPERF
jgi:heme exporter protein D